jgi:hypothetical protein
VKGYDDGGDVSGGITGASNGQDLGEEPQPAAAPDGLAALQGAQIGAAQGQDASYLANPAGQAPNGQSVLHYITSMLTAAAGKRQAKQAAASQSKGLLGGLLGGGGSSGGSSGGSGAVADYLGYAEGGAVSEGNMTKKVPAMVSPGEIYLTPDHVKQVLEGNANPLKIGHKYAGMAKVQGDSRKNDTIPVTLDDGGVVIPRHVVNKMNAKDAELFVRRAHSKRGSDNA